MVNQDNLKDFLKNLKKGVQIGVLGAALTTGSIMGVGCANSSDGDTKDNQTVTNPGNTSNSQYDTPYDKTLGNGNYFIHSFIGDKDGIQPNTVVDDTNHYLKLGETYIKNLANNFNRSLDGRTGAQNYFNSFVSSINNNNNFKVSTGSTNLDFATNIISRACEPIMNDIIRNLNNSSERAALYLCYSVMDNESYKLGLGNYRNSSSKLMDEYKANRNGVVNYWKTNDYLKSVDMDDDIDNQNCRHITNTVDTLLNTAANNMGNGITASDLRQVVNMAMTTKSLMAMHDRTQNNLKHNNNCVMLVNIVNSMYETANEMFYAEQQQNQGMTY